MIPVPSVFLKGTLQLELPSRVLCSFLLSLLPFCVFYPKEGDAKICPQQGHRFIVDLIPTLPILRIAAKNKDFQKFVKMMNGIMNEEE